MQEGGELLDKAKGHLAGHLIVGHLMSGDVLRNESATVHAGSELILFWYAEVIFHTREELLFDDPVVDYAGKVHHLDGWYAVMWLCE